VSEPLIRLVLPVPPSANALFTTRAGSRQRIKSDTYRAWIVEAGWAVARSGALSDRLRHVRVECDMPFDYRRDLDNAIKPVADLLVRHELIADDRWIDEWRVRRVPAGDLIVSIWRL